MKTHDDFVFDSEMLVQTVYFGFRIGELSCPTRYFNEASSINFRRSVKYGFGVLGSIMKYLMEKWGVKQFQDFQQQREKTSCR